MTTRPYGLDRWIGQVTITAATQTIVMSEAGGSNFSVSLAVGDYWLYDGAEVGGYPSFFARLLAAIHLANGSNVYAFRPITSPHSAYAFGGLELYRVSGSDSFSLKLNSLSWTLDRRLLGFDADDTEVINSDAAARIQSRRTVWGQWVPPTIAADKRCDTTHETYAAQANGRAIGVYEWASDTIRRFEYLRCPAAAVRRSRAAELPEYAERVGKAYGDTHHTWQDLHEQAAAGGVLLVLHNDGHTSMMLYGASWEAVQLASAEQRNSFEATLREASRVGETYDVVPTVYVLDGTLEHT